MTGFIRMENISFRYHDEPLISDLRLDIEAKGLTVLKGRNASGKTTLSKLMAGILKPQKGRVLVNGEDTRNISLGQIGQQIGYLFQEPERQLFAPTALEEISFPMRFRDHSREYIKERAMHALSLFGLAGMEDRFPFSLSMGEKQRLALAALLVNEPRFLILDEPGSALDEEAKGILRKVLTNELDKGTGILIISHDTFIFPANEARHIEIDRGSIINDRKSL